MADPPPSKKQRTAAYKTCPPQIRGKHAHKKANDLTSAQIAALASAYVIVHPELVKQKNKAPITEFAAEFGTDPTRRKFLRWASSALKEWREQGTIPEKAAEHIEKNHSSVWPSIPFIKRILRQREQERANAAASSAGASSVPVSAGPSCQVDATPGCSRTVTTEQQQVTFAEDLFDENSELWVDEPEEGDEGDAGRASSSDEAQQVADFLDKATVSFLHATNRRKETLSWERIMKYWLTYANVGLEYIDKMLRWIKTNNAVLTEQQIRKLPKTGKTFLKLTDAERKTVHAIKTRNESGNEIGLYMHYGLMNGVFGTSAGIYAITCASPYISTKKIPLKE